jgi:hypothetical protein
VKTSSEILKGGSKRKIKEYSENLTGNRASTALNHGKPYMMTTTKQNQPTPGFSGDRQRTANLAYNNSTFKN